MQPLSSFLQRFGPPLHAHTRMQDHVQQQLATIIKHTHVAAPWPQVPLAMATGGVRMPGSSATSVSDISSRHLIASGGTPLPPQLVFFPYSLHALLCFSRLYPSSRGAVATRRVAFGANHRDDSQI